MNELMSKISFPVNPPLNKTMDKCVMAKDELSLNPDNPSPEYDFKPNYSQT